eukprot:TRINITY_DN36592_c0_g1_i1.p1 TRINITY_DN36592_c0_g1~~TRINITY_DN36592_c0_g1_i1.p1  ORF type:complete len:128 (-),score=24.26 TRINITY_DN36592_c0_g1_i1:128-511(-)
MGLRLVQASVHMRPIPGVVVKKVLNQELAGKLCPGMKLLEVNQVDVTGMMLGEVTTLLMNSGPQVQISFLLQDGTICMPGTGRSAAQSIIDTLHKENQQLKQRLTERPCTNRDEELEQNSVVSSDDS